MATLRVVMISVAQAKTLVKQRRSSARRNMNAIHRYALEMRQRRWILNGVPIIISNTGVLYDGYQRLLACIEAQTPFKTVLICGAAGGIGDAHVECAPLVTCIYETISSDLATQYLACSLHDQGLSLARITALTGDLMQRREIFDAQPICFAHTGRLLKGRHRLRAVIQAGGVAKVAVIRGLDEAAYETYDLCAKRRAGVNRTSAFGDMALVSAMANLLWRYEHKTLAIDRAKASAGEISQIIIEHPRLLGLRSFARRMGHYGRASVMGYAAYVIERDDAALATAFFAMLEDSMAGRPGHPMRALCAALQTLRRRKAPQEKQLTMLLAGWERFKARQSSFAGEEVFRNPLGTRAL